jgi:hypothetical protein
MWVSDTYWFPHVLVGKKMMGEIHFKGDGGEIDRAEMKEMVSQ